MINHSAFKHESIRLISLIVAILTLSFNIFLIDGNLIVFAAKSFLFPFTALYLLDFFYSYIYRKDRRLYSYALIFLLYLFSTFILYHILDYLLYWSPFQTIYFYESINITPLIQSSFYSFIYVVFMKVQINIAKHEKDLSALKLEEIKLESEAKESKLRSLKSKIDPSFFDQSLNIIQQQIEKKPKYAEKLMISLARFYRKQLDASEKHFSRLEKEIEQIELYNELSKSKISIGFNNELNDLKIRSGLLLELIKVFKNKSLDILIKLHNEKIIINIANDKIDIEVFRQLLNEFYEDNIIEYKNNSLKIEIPE